MASVLQILQHERQTLKLEGTSLVTSAESAPDVMAALSRSEPRRREIAARLEEIDAEITAETARRDAIRALPSDPNATSEAPVSITALPAASTRLVRTNPGARGYAAMFADQLGSRLERDGFTSLDEYLSTVQTGMADPRLHAAAGSMSGTVGSDGGFLIPTQYAAQLLDGSLEAEIVRPRATVEPMTSDTKKVSGFSAKDHTGGSIYGFTPVWMAELGANTSQKGSVAQITLNANKLALFAMASNELASDGTDYETQLSTAMYGSCSFGLDTAFLTGNGVGKPLGILNDPALITVAKETGQANDTILVENIDKMFARMHPAGRLNAVWVVNSTAIPQLLSLVRTVGTGGVPVPVMSESNGQFSILTRPVIFTEKLPALGDAGDIVFVDFREYVIGMRKEAVLDKSNAVGWSTDEMAYRVILRVDGRGRWTGPVTPLNGDTLSWCVRLAAR